MSRAICKQAIAVSVLLATLSMMAPAPAQAAAWAPAGKAPWSSGWSWISALWDHLATLLHGGGPATTAAPMDGSYINPDGQAPH